MDYKVSKDYPRLKQLMDEGHKVVCWVTYDMNGYRGDGNLLVTDVLQAFRRGEGESLTYYLSSRGFCFMEFHPGWAFERYTEEGMFDEFKTYNLQFIDPDAERNTLDLVRVCWYDQQ